MKELPQAVEAALEYRRRGWSVIPLRPKAKEPAIAWRKYQEELPSKEEVQRWWTNQPGANIGIITGRISGVVVIDLDSPKAETALEEFLGEIPRTPAVQTGKGKQLYFAHPGEPVPNGVRILPDVDVRGDGGYVVAPPSIHPNGTRYRWIIPCDVPLAPLPEKLLDLLRKPEVPQREEKEPVPAEAKGRIARRLLKRALRRAEPGNRNDVGFWLACQLRDAGLSMEEAEAHMLEYASKVPQGKEPYTEREALASLRSAYGEPPRDPPKITKIQDRDVNGWRRLWPDLNRLPMTETGNAEAFGLLFGDCFRYNWTAKEWLYWDGKRWAPDTTGEAERAMLLAVRERGSAAFQIEEEVEQKKRIKWALSSENRRRLQASLEIAQSLCPFPIEAKDLDRDPWLLNVQNGTLDLRTGELRPHRQEDFITRILDYPYNPDAECPRWDEFLGEIFDWDGDLAYFVRKAVGYSLTGDVSEDVFFLLYGKGCNGKTTFLDTLRTILGPYALQAEFSTFLTERTREAPSPGIARLAGARFVVAIEVPEGKRLAEAVLKSLTGGDTLVARFLYQKTYFEFRPQHKLWLAANHRPVIRDFSPAMWRRIRLVPFEVSFLGREDPRLQEKLLSEAEGILAWAVRGCLEWQGESLEPPKAVQAATEEYYLEQDQLGRFLRACCEEDPSATCPASDLYEAYEEWCERSAEEPMSKNAFGRQMGERFSKGRGHGGRTIYRGVRVKD